MKIAYTISGLFNSGGMENILTQKANYLADRLGYDVTIITTDQKGREGYFPLSDKVKRVDLGVNYCDFKDSKLWQIKKELLKKRHRARLSEVLDAEKFDVCISLMDFDFDFLYKINDGSRKMIESHFSRYAKVLATPNRLMQFAQKVRTFSWKNRISKYDRFVVLTHEDKAQWGDLPNIEVIPNFINTDPTNFASQDSKKIISVGRMDYQKGYDMLLNAWKIAQKKLPGWQLDIFGGGDKKPFMDIIETENIKAVTFHNPTSEIGKKYAESSFYVMSSRYEGLPLVLLEAMSCGLPVVSFQCPCGPADIIKDKFGILVPPGDTETLADAIVRCAENQSWRESASQNARAEARNYSKDAIMKRWQDLFQALNHK